MNFDQWAAGIANHIRNQQTTNKSKEIRELLNAKRIAAVGSRVTCSPPPMGTDEDYLLLVEKHDHNKLTNAGYTADSFQEFYEGMGNDGGFLSYRKDSINLIVTNSTIFFNKFLLASSLAKQFNLLDKEDRITLFQAILYGNGKLLLVRDE